MLQSWKKNIFFYCNSNVYVFFVLSSKQCPKDPSHLMKSKGWYLKKEVYVLQAHLKSHVLWNFYAVHSLSYFHPAPPSLFLTSQSKTWPAQRGINSFCVFHKQNIFNTNPELACISLVCFSVDHTSDNINSTKVKIYQMYRLPIIHNA